MDPKRQMRISLALGGLLAGGSILGLYTLGWLVPVWTGWLGYWGWGWERHAGPFSEWSEPVKWLMLIFGTSVGVGLFVAGCAWLVGRMLFGTNVFNRGP